MNQKKFLDKFMSVLKNIGTFLFLMMIAVVILQILNRHVLKTGINWTLEAAQYLFVINVFLGSIIAFYEREHIVINTLVNRLPEKCIPYLRLLVNGAYFIFLYMLANGAIVLCKRTWTAHAGALVVLGIRRGYLYAVLLGIITVFFIVILVDTIKQIIKIVKRKAECGK